MASFNFASAFSHFLCAVLAELYSWSVAISVYIIGFMGFFLGSPYFVEVIVIHIEGAMTIKAEAKSLGEHHSLGVFELVIGVPQTGIKLTLHIQRVSVGGGVGVCFFVILRILLIEVYTVFVEQAASRISFVSSAVSPNSTATASIAVSA